MTEMHWVIFACTVLFIRAYSLRIERQINERCDKIETDAFNHSEQSLATLQPLIEKQIELIDELKSEIEELKHRLPVDYGEAS